MDDAADRLRVDSRLFVEFRASGQPRDPVEARLVFGQDTVLDSALPAAVAAPTRPAFPQGAAAYRLIEAGSLWSSMQPTRRQRGHRLQS
jgi:hypothetical protein